VVGRFDRDLEDVFAIQDEISLSIAATLRITLSETESEAIGKVPTTDLRAYDYYLRGRQFYYQYKRKGSNSRCRCSLTRLSWILPTRAPTRAGGLLLLALSLRGEPRESPQGCRRREPRGRRTGPRLRGGARVPWVALSLRSEYEEAEREFETAIRLDPLLYEPYYFHARTAFAQGNLEHAIELYEKASESDPRTTRLRSSSHRAMRTWGTPRRRKRRAAAASGLPRKGSC